MRPGEMSYRYVNHKEDLLRDNLPKLIRARDAFLEMIKETGAARAGLIFKCWEGGGDSWTIMAALDYMVELGDISYVEGTTNRNWQSQLVEEVRRS